ncbi:MAG: hypothetical protein AB7D96_11150 [Arcobacteraceae bacterium]|jgi:hypothetical protein
MFEDSLDLTKFRTTLKKVIENIESLEDIHLDGLKDEVEAAFENYNYDGEDSIKFCEKWESLENGKTYELCVGIDHEDAYELTVHVKVDNDKATVTNVL